MMNSQLEPQTKENMHTLKHAQYTKNGSTSLGVENKLQHERKTSFHNYQIICTSINHTYTKLLSWQQDRVHNANALLCHCDSKTSFQFPLGMSNDNNRNKKNRDKISQSIT